MTFKEPPVLRHPVPPVKVFHFTSYRMIQRHGLPRYMRPFSLSLNIPAWFRKGWPNTQLLRSWSPTKEIFDLVKSGGDWVGEYLIRVAASGVIPPRDGVAPSRAFCGNREDPDEIVKYLPNHAVMITWTERKEECYRFPLMRWLHDRYHDTILIGRPPVPGRLIIVEWDGEDGVSEAPVCELNRQAARFARSFGRSEKRKRIQEKAEGRIIRKARRPAVASRRKQRAVLDSYGAGEQGAGGATLFGLRDAPDE